MVHVQTDVYNLAVRMLWCPDDAADATQEILLKVVTRLASFRGESAFRTWVYRIAANHLLDVRRSRVERESLTFAAFGEISSATAIERPAGGMGERSGAAASGRGGKDWLYDGHAALSQPRGAVAYIFGDVFELSGAEAAEVLNISTAAFRQRLSRARAGVARVHVGRLRPRGRRRTVSMLAAHARRDVDRPGQR